MRTRRKGALRGGVCLATALLFFALAGAAQAGVLYGDPGWDLIYAGDADGFGTGGFNALDGNWQHDQSDKWDGSAPGAIGAAPGGNSPGGVAALSAGGTTYLRIQDTGNPEQEQPDGAGGFTAPWTGESNRRFYFGHDIEVENPGATSVLTGGITISFRARIASSGVLDDVYPDFLDAVGEVPDLQEITPWPAAGKGYNVKDDGLGMFTVQQNGANGIGFALALDIDTPAGVPGGLIMSNQGGVFFPGTDQATPSSANVLPISDADLLDWHEFWITIRDSGAASFGRPILTVEVFMDGSLGATQFDVQSSFSSAFPGQFVAFGLPSTTSFGAVDIDFYSYKLGVITPVAAPAVPALGAQGSWALVAGLLAAAWRVRRIIHGLRRASAPA